jgi:hypothetical protein
MLTIGVLFYYEYPIVSNDCDSLEFRREIHIADVAVLWLTLLSDRGYIKLLTCNRQIKYCQGSLTADWLVDICVM